MDAAPSLFRVSSTHQEIELEAENWLVALGEFLHLIGQDGAIARLACERLPNGTVLAIDVAQRLRVVVQPVAARRAA